MKLKIKEFRNFAKGNNISPKVLLVRLGGGKYAYRHLKSGCSLGYDLARDIYNAFGEEVFLNIVDFEEETIDGFKSKYIQIAGKLY